jgi:3D-(3,5/4)-trihydroxycyclohexane-1,2-dione acylhydrolase (decyclizing)
VHSRAELEDAIAQARALPQDGGPVVIHVETDPLVFAPDSDSWWDVPVSQVSTLTSTKKAYKDYAGYKSTQRHLTAPTVAPRGRAAGRRAKEG